MLSWILKNQIWLLAPNPASLMITLIVKSSHTHWGSHPFGVIEPVAPKGVGCLSLLWIP